MLLDPPHAFMPATWFWKADDGRIYSSQRNALANATDAAYAAWEAAGGVPSCWPRDDAGAQTNAALNAVLTVYQLPAMPGA